MPLINVIMRSASLLCLVALLSVPLWPQQPMSKFEHERADEILQMVANETKPLLRP
jgi:hypothetical protein